MKKLIAGACGALILISSASAAYAQSRKPAPGAGGRGEAGYEFGCALMWIFNYPACAELPNFPQRFRDQMRQA